MKKSQRILAVGSVALLAFTVTPALAADTIALPAMADAHVRSGPENENKPFGSAVLLYVKKSGVGTDGFHRETYLKFDLAGVKAIVSGKLRLHCPDPKEFAEGVMMEIRSSPAMDWTDGPSEKSITWVNRPAAGSSVHATGAWAPGWNEWDLTPFLRAEIAAGRHAITLVVRNSAGSKSPCVISSREAAAHQPELMLAFPDLPEPAAATIVLKAIADAYMRSGPEKENVRFGPAAALCVKKSNVETDGFHRESYLKFDLAGVKSIASGKLRLYCHDPIHFAAVAMEIRSSPITDWTDDRTEKSITWANRPAAGSTVHATGAWARGWNEWDLTPFLRAEIAAGRKVVTLVMRNSAESRMPVVMKSREAATHQPELLLAAARTTTTAPND
ncbi:MAG: DUF7594 domain-containing protein [Opitutaceae bacterium]